jgi:hypothetical protein
LVLVSQHNYVILNVSQSAFVYLSEALNLRSNETYRSSFDTNLALMTCRPVLVR